ELVAFFRGRRSGSASTRRPRSCHPGPREVSGPSCSAGPWSEIHAGDRSKTRFETKSGLVERMFVVHEGGCLCGDVRYKTFAQPLRVTICHCRFCQRFTGSSYLIEPIFRRQDVVFEGAPARTYEHRSDTSGKRVMLNFCARCGTTLCLDLERFPDI